MFKIIQGGKRNAKSISQKATEPISKQDFIAEHDAFIELAYEYAYAESDTDSQRILFELTQQGNKFISLFDDDAYSFSDEALALKIYVQDYIKRLPSAIPYLKLVQ